ncbi:expressed unknown protein [Seminavis robusta]|uniref:Right handed beta helix domain-containing protein n=1 Tax=Seminavis robusta TaxID=568900 RepID=A0A9N8F098_9STRA|nr:expressed unknown protein [Seminavis robusta]|eukprot:Sro2772_g336800.1 n/a (311) ;mRNA; f:7265-8830
MIRIAALFLLFATGFAQDCYDNLTSIYEEIGDDSKVDEPKRFVLCPNTIFDAGFLVPGEGITGGQFPLIPRSNTEYSCGEDGSSANNCIIRGGDFGMMSVPIFFRNDQAVDNVVLKGITFERQEQYGIFLGMPGDIIYEDCIVRDQENLGPVFVNYESEVLDDAQNLDVTFSSSLFSNNTQAARGLGIEFGVMTIRGDAYTKVTVDSCLFTQNQYGNPINAPIGYAIHAYPNTNLILKNSCFVENSFLGGGTVVVAEDSFFALIGANHADGGADFILICDYVARYPTEQDRANLNPTCIPSQSDVCLLQR